MTDYHLATFVTDKDGGGTNSPDATRERDKMKGKIMSKRKMFQDGLQKGLESEYVAGNEHGGSRRIYFAQKAQKQANQASDHIRESDIFKECKIFNNSGKSPHEMKRLIEKHGGRVVFTREIEPITHYMTNVLTDTEKRQEASKKFKDKHKYFTVTEAWVFDSIKAGKRLNEADYSPYGRVAKNINQFLRVGPTYAVKRPRNSSSSSSVSHFDRLRSDRTESEAGGEGTTISKYTGDISREATTETTGNNSRGVGEHEEEEEEGGSGEPTIEANPRLFLRQYLSNSRLHFLGTWRDRAYAIYKAMQQFHCEVSAEHVPCWLPQGTPEIDGRRNPNLHLGSTDRSRVVLHADMDCFFVTAALVSAGHTSLIENVCPGAGPIVNIPVAVSHGHDETDLGATADNCRGTEQGMTGNELKSPLQSRHVHAEVSSCNYSARGYGVRAGMSLGKARQLCPDLRVVPYAFEAYDRLSAIIYEILLSFGAEHQYCAPGSPLGSFSSASEASVCNPLSRRCQVEIVSVDEAFVELPHGSDGVAAAKELGARVHAVTGCRMSVGVGANKLLARLATRRAKPPNASAVFSIDDHAAYEELQAAFAARRVSGKNEAHSSFSHSASPSPSPSLSQATPPSHARQVANIGTGTDSRVEEAWIASLGLSPVARAYLLQIKLSELPGVGWKTQRGLAEAGLNTGRDVLEAEWQGQLESKLRATNVTRQITRAALLKLCMGEDSRRLIGPEEGLLSKSIAVEVTWGVRFSRQDRVELFLKCVCEEVKRRLELHCRQGKAFSYRKLTMKVMKRHPAVPQTNTPQLMKQVLRGSKFLGHGKCLSYSRTQTFPHGVMIEKLGAEWLAREVLALFSRLQSEHAIDVIDLRGLGVQVADFASASTDQDTGAEAVKETTRETTILDHLAAQAVQNNVPKLRGSQAQHVQTVRDSGAASSERGTEGEGDLSHTQEEVLMALTDPADRAAALQMLRNQPSSSSSSGFGVGARGAGVRRKKPARQPGIRDHFLMKENRKGIHSAPMGTASGNGRVTSASAPASAKILLVDLTEEDDDTQWLSLSQDQEESRDPYYVQSTNKDVEDATECPYDGPRQAWAEPSLWNATSVGGPGSFASFIREQINAQCDDVLVKKGPTEDVALQCVRHASSLVRAGQLQPVTFFVRTLRRGVSEIEDDCREKKILWQALLDEVIRTVKNESMARFSFPLSLDH